MSSQQFSQKGRDKFPPGTEDKVRELEGKLLSKHEILINGQPNAADVCEYQLLSTQYANITGRLYQPPRQDGN